MPTVKGRGQKARLVRGLNLVLRAHSEYDVFNCHVTTRAWAPPLSPPQVLRCGLEAPAPADSLEHGRCGRLGRCPFPVTPSRRDARTRRGPTGSVISRQLLRVLSPRWALGDREADRNRGGGGGGRLREGRDPSGHPRRAWSCEDLREAAAACLWGTPMATCWPVRPLHRGRPPWSWRMSAKELPHHTHALPTLLFPTPARED